MDVPEVSTLPVLDQSDFPPLPEIPADKCLLCFDTKWQNAEKEFAVSCLVDACIRAKKWQPVRSEQFAERLMANPMVAPFISRGVANAMWSLVGEGYVLVINYQGINYFVPTTKLANAVLADPRKLRVV